MEASPEAPAESSDKSRNFPTWALMPHVMRKMWGHYFSKWGLMISCITKSCTSSGPQGPSNANQAGAFGDITC